MSLLLVLEYPLQQITRNADVEGMAPAGHDIRAIDPLFHGENLSQIVEAGNQRGPQLSSLTRRQRIEPQKMLSS